MGMSTPSHPGDSDKSTPSPNSRDGGFTWARGWSGEQQRSEVARLVAMVALVAGETVARASGGLVTGAGRRVVNGFGGW